MTEKHKMELPQAISGYNLKDFDAMRHDDRFVQNLNDYERIGLKMYYEICMEKIKTITERGVDSLN